MAELFDRTAPTLLRVACHVARDLASAEDLVQQTFVTAIERWSRFDASRPVLPWLLGILANHSRNARRRVVRAGDLEALPALEPVASGGGVVAAAGLRELDGIVQRELDRLAEPYREVAILTLRHQLKPAEIARALGRSPGSVRVQLHRALEQLRQRLPRSCSMASLVAPSLLSELGRGLAAVRASVVDAASEAAVGVASGVAAGSVITIGSWMAMKKGLVGAVLLVAAGAGALWWSDSNGKRAEPVDSPITPSTPTEAVARLDDEVAPSGGTVSPTALREASQHAPRPPDPSAAAMVAEIRGDVIEATTSRPLPGVTIEFFAPLQLTLDDATRRFGDYAHGNLRCVGQLHFAAGWPRIVLPLPENAWRDGALVEVCAPPDPASVPLARAQTDAEGRFALSLSRSNGVLVVSHADFERQVVVVPIESGNDASRSATSAGKGAPEVSIALERLGEIEGYLVDEAGEPVREPVRLRLMASSAERTPNASTTPFEQRRARRAGPWLIDTDEGGAFAASIGAACVQVDCVTPGFEIVERREERSGRTWHSSPQLRPDEGGAPALLVVRRMPVLTVLDAKSGAPIESFSLLGTSMESGSVAYFGRVHAPRGRLELESGPRPTGYGAPRMGPLRISVWTKAHAPQSVEIAPSDRRASCTVELEAGATPEVRGHVLKRGVPVGGAAVSLNAYYPLSWRPDDLQRIDEVASGSDGAFLLHGPPGKYVVKVVEGAAPPCLRLVELPLALPLRIDLAGGGTIEVVVRDPAGEPRSEAKVCLRSPSQQERAEYTDAAGVARFEGLEVGLHLVTLNGTRDEHVPLPQALERVVVVEGKAAAIALTAPPAGPIRLRITADGVTDFTGWRAREGMYVVSEWHDLGGEGAIDADAANWTRIEVAAPDGFHWRLPLPLATLMSGVVEIPISEVGYRGRVVDRLTGAPLAGAIVRASVADSETNFHVAAGADGRFELQNLDPAVHTLSVRRDPKSADPDAPAWFSPSQPAAPRGREVVLRVPDVRGDRVEGMARRVFRGRVVHRGAGAPAVNASLMLTARFSDDDGEWGVAVEGAHARSGPDGSYEFVAVRAPSYHLWAQADDASGVATTLREVWIDGGGSGEVESRDITFE